MTPQPRNDSLDQEVRAYRHLPPPAMRRAIRLTAGLSEQDVANELKVSRASVSRWETGKRRPRRHLLVAYVDLLERIAAVA